MATSSLHVTDGVPRCPSRTTPACEGQALSRSLVALDQNSTIIAVIEMSQSSWLIAGVLPGIERQPRKKLEPNAEGLLGLLRDTRGMDHVRLHPPRLEPGLDKQQAVQEKPALLACYREGINAHLMA